MQQLLKKIQEKKNDLISERALREQSFGTFFEQLRNVDRSLIAGLEGYYDIDTATCRDVFPSLYVEKFDEQTAKEYKEEYIKFTEFLQGIDAIRSDLIRKAEAAINESENRNTESL